MEILGPDSSVPGGQQFDKLDDQSQHELRRWAPELIRDELGQPIFRTFEVFPVLP